MANDTGRTNPLAEKIKQRRSQMLIHSCLYYHMYESVVSDHQWQAWANELRDLQNLFGREIGFFDEAFAGWDGSTGFHLPLRDPYVMSRAERLLANKGSF